MNKKIGIGTLITVWLLFCCSMLTMAYEDTSWYMPEESASVVQSEPDILTYTTLPTYYEVESMTNATLSCKYWNGKTLKAGQTIDFINTMSRENAYEGMVEAPAITGVDLYGNPIVEYSFGGGICATAVALGNTADHTYIVASGTEHTERSLYVRPEDKDFTVAEGIVEMYLTNYTAYDYLINMWVNPDTSITASLTKIIP